MTTIRTRSGQVDMFTEDDVYKQLEFVGGQNYDNEIVEELIANQRQGRNSCSIKKKKTLSDLPKPGQPINSKLSAEGNE